MRDADEHRSTMLCSECFAVLQKVYSLTPERVYLAAEAKAARVLPWGWTRAPPRRVAAWRVVRGLLRCQSDGCRDRSLRHRDIDALPLILFNAMSLDAGEGGLARMRHVRHGDPPPGRFDIFPR